MCFLETLSEIQTGFFPGEINHGFAFKYSSKQNQRYWTRVVDRVWAPAAVTGTLTGVFWTRHSSSPSFPLPQITSGWSDGANNLGEKSIVTEI